MPEPELFRQLLQLCVRQLVQMLDREILLELSQDLAS
jgi:hypothetical protein